MISRASLVVLVTVLAGCSTEQKAPTAATKPAAAHGQEHGPAVALGSAQIAGVSVAATRAGDIAPGREIDLDLTFAAGKLPISARAWIGIDTAVGSAKTKLAREGESVMHGFVEVPKPLRRAAGSGSSWSSATARPAAARSAFEQFGARHVLAGPAQRHSIFNALLVPKRVVSVRSCTSTRNACPDGTLKWCVAPPFASVPNGT